MGRKLWTSEEHQYIRDNITEKTPEEIAKALRRTLNSVYCRIGLLGLTNIQGRKRNKRNSRKNHGISEQSCKKWTPEEEAYLMDSWGVKAVTTIAAKLQRTVQSVKIRASRLQLGPALMAGEYITFNQLSAAFGNLEDGSCGYKMKSWVEKRGFPVYTKRVVDSSFRVVYLNEFWEWAEKNRSFLDFSRMEPLALGKEPPWVAEQRKIDFVSYANQRKDPWTPQEDQRLVHLLKQHKYTWAEISREMRRSAGAIQHRCNDLGLKERPVRESPHNPWSDADLQLMADMIRRGYSYTMIGDACGGRSEKAVRGVVYQRYHTESADKVRAMLGNGPWGTGAPEPTVKSEKHKETVRKPMARLCELLLIRRNSMEWGEYWQRDLCQHWSDVRGCLMHGSDCDSCTKFQRIRPQYCRLCVGEFLDRVEQTYCPKCRSMRKKQAQRKYAVLHARGRV